MHKTNPIEVPFLMDTHSHLQFKDYDADRDAVLGRMKEKHVWTITVGTTMNESRKAAELASREAGVWAAVGFHPEHFSSDFNAGGEENLEPYSISGLGEIASSDKVVAIGETGLDYYRLDPEKNIEQVKAEQRKVFCEHLALAYELKLPVILHCRNALQDMLDVIRQEREKGIKIKGVVHCFGGSWEEASRILEADLSISFTGLITFPPRKNDDPGMHVHRVIENLPLDRIMVETDAPFLAPVPYRGKRNEPVYVEEVAKKIAELKNSDFVEVAKITTEAAVDFFSLNRP
jgi:TatD DNase family protein